MTEIVEPQGTWLVDLVANSSADHFLIYGHLGAGKTVLAENILSIASYYLWLDARFPAKKVVIDPVRLGWEGAVKAVANMRSEISDRMERQVAGGGILYVVDGVDRLCAAGEDFELLSRANCSRTKARAILTAQSYRSGSRLRDAGLYNFARIYLGYAEAMCAISEVIKPALDLRHHLKEQVYARQELVSQLKTEGAMFPVEQCFGLVWVQGLPPFVAQMPAPQAYAAISVRDRPEELQQLLRSLSQRRWLVVAHPFDEDRFSLSEEGLRGVLLPYCTSEEAIAFARRFSFRQA